MGSTALRTRIRRYFLAGLLALLPTIVVGYILWFFWGKLNRATKWIFYTFQIESRWWSELLFPVIALLLGVLATIIVGVTSRTLFGRGFVRIWERVMIRIPVLSRVYVVVQQIIASLSTQHRTLFREVVLIEYPREGMYRLAFVASDGLSDLIPDEELTPVFVPNTPNVTAGFVFLLPRRELIRVDIPADEAIKMIISGGFVRPTMGNRRNHVGTSPSEELTASEEPVPTKRDRIVGA